MADANFTAQDAVTATTALRASLGLEPEHFGKEQFVGMISDEIKQLRKAGKSDEDISGILADAGLSLDGAAIGKFYADSDERGPH